MMNVVFLELEVFRSIGTMDIIGHYCVMHSVIIGGIGYRYMKAYLIGSNKGRMTDTLGYWYGGKYLCK